MKTVYCDYCRQEIKETFMQLRISYLPAAAVVSGERTLRLLDICDDCFKSFVGSKASNLRVVIVDP